MRGIDGWSTGVSLEHYRCQKVIAKNSKMERISDTVEFRHQKITTPAPTPEDRIMHGIQQLIAVLKGDKVSASDAQMKAIQSLQETLINWSEEDKLETQKENMPRGLKEQPRQVRHLPRVKRTSRPKMARAPRVQRRPLSRPEPTVQPIAHRTRSRTAKKKSQEVE